ncbi:MMPL family transporter [Nocardia fluminea]|uniref:MMPL family transporter n=1 Tax=Nocardia fluminea TaxID=134984 RepID=UPI003407863C
MTTLALLCSRWRYAVAGLWLILLIALAGGVFAAGSGFTDVADLPDGEASRAYSLLDQGAGEPTTISGKIAWHTDGAVVDSDPVRSEVSTWLRQVADQPGVTAVVSPYAQAGAAQLSQAENTAYASVEMTDDADADAIRGLVENLAADSVVPADLTFGGQAFVAEPGASGGTEIMGVLAALVILLIVFRSMWAALLPILTGVAGVGVSLLVVMLGSHLIDLSATCLTMAALIGLGVGIDYALFIVNRYRNALMTGATVQAAVAKAVDTSGRAVVFAGLTVAVALGAIVVVGLGILTGMAQAAALTVLVTVLAALTLLPALLAMLGHRVLSRRQRRILAQPLSIAEPSHADGERHGMAARWSSLVLRFPRGAALIATGLMIVLALPVLSMRVGNSDASSDPAGSAGREYASMMAPAFGDGVDASLLLVAEVPDAQAEQAFTQLVATAAGITDVASVSAAPIQAGQTVAVATVTPATSAQQEQTQQLVHALRDEVIPAAENGTALQVYVGGETATNIDVADALMSKLPLYLGLVALFGFLLLAIAFRSILVPLIGAISNIGTILAALGVATAIFQFGWGSELLGVGDAAPIMYFLPILIVGIMFGLSMDYQVFLVSRMHEEWTHTRDNERSIRVGLTETAKVIVTAGLIMLAVFASFGFSGERIVATIGIGLAAGVLVDAFVVRMILMPALMKLIGRRNWSYPAWADRVTPHVSVEGTPDLPPSPVAELAVDAESGASVHARR